VSVDVNHTLAGPEDAPALVFSNSLGTTGAMWEAQAASLSERFRVLRYDTRGHGGTPAPPGPYTVADLAGDGARVKWPNDVLLDDRKVAGVLVEARPQDGWAVLGIGVNVAAAPPGLGERAGALGAADPEAVLRDLLPALERWLGAPAPAALAALRERDALLGRAVTWGEGSGVGAGIDDAGGLRVRLAGGGHVVLSAGEVHLG